MLKPTPRHHQPNLFGNDLLTQLNEKGPYLKLASKIPWQEFEEAFGKLYTDFGRPSVPIRVMVGILIIKQLNNLSDEAVVSHVMMNPYYQAFCGYKEFQKQLPCDASQLSRFRKRIGKEGKR